MKRSNHTYNKENCFFYIWKRFQSSSERKIGYKIFCSWLIHRPIKGISLIRLCVAQRKLIQQLEYKLHCAEYSRDYHSLRCTQLLKAEVAK